MSESEKRLKGILTILEEQGFITVSELAARFHYSTATINRDLNTLEKNGLIERTYGGARMRRFTMIPYQKRMLLYRNIKRQIGCAAASLIEDGDTVFIDGSTTTEYIASYLNVKERLTIITNNTFLSAMLSEMGIHVIQLGGDIREKPYITGGTLAAENAAAFMADKLFFSTGGLSADGKLITSMDYYRQMLINMMNNSKKRYFLVDSSKVGTESSEILHPTVLCDFSSIDAVISDYTFSSGLQAQFPDTEFICIDKS